MRRRDFLKSVLAVGASAACAAVFPVPQIGGPAPLGVGFTWRPTTPGAHRLVAESRQIVREASFAQRWFISDEDYEAGVRRFLNG